MFKNRWLIMTSILIILISMVSCIDHNLEGPRIEVNQDNEKVTLRFVNAWGGTDSQAPALKQIFEEFMVENPDIVIRNEATGGGDFLQKIKTDFAVGNDPDVFGIWPGSDMEMLIKAGKVADLTALLEEDCEWKRSFGESAWEYCTVDSKIYGLPVEIIYEALFINEEIFDKYEVNPPETIEDLNILAFLFSSKGVTPIACNFEAEGTYLYQNMVAQIGSKEGVESIDDSYRQSLYSMRELYNKRAFPENAYRLSNAERDELFLNGEAAMIVQGSWFVKDIYEAGMGEKVDILPFPSYSKSEGYTLIYGLGCGTFFMSQKAKGDAKKEEPCIRLLKELTSPESSLKYCNNSGFISNIGMSHTANMQSELYTKGLNLINNATELAPPPDSIINRNFWEKELVPGIASIFGEDGPEKIEGLWEKLHYEKN